MKKKLLATTAALLMVFTFFITPTHADSNNVVLDTDGNPVYAGKEYAVRVLTYTDDGTYLGWNFWYQFNWFGTEWTKLAGIIEDSNYYKFDSGRTIEIYENDPRKIIMVRTNAYLHYQPSEFLHSEGGMYAKRFKNGSINFTLKKAENGYQGYRLVADDGPLYSDPYNTGSMIAAKQDYSHQFTVEFIKMKD
ncbi:hypothetical protein OCA23_27270 [Bacillus cereus]|nr:hypothetical protein [Bacillus cereus]